MNTKAIAQVRAHEARSELVKAEKQLADDRHQLSKAIEAKEPTEKLELIGDVIELDRIEVVQLTNRARDYDVIMAGKRVFT